MRSPNLTPRGQVPPLILIVDDEPDIRTVLEMMLAANGYQTRTAADGHAALDELAACDPALLLTDLLMPHCDGFELITAVRAAESPGDRLPVLALSALAEREHLGSAMTAGADRVIEKPFEVDALLTAVGELLER